MVTIDQDDKEGINLLLLMGLSKPIVAININYKTNQEKAFNQSSFLDEHLAPSSTVFPKMKWSPHVSLWQDNKTW